MTSADNLLEKRLKLAVSILEKDQGAKNWPGPSNTLDSLMLTILSQNTNDKLRDRAYSILRSRFRTWTEVLNAPVNEVEEAIKIAGLSKQKAANIQNFLRWAAQHFGGLSLESLGNIENGEAIKLLTTQKGVGIKTAAVVLMATLGRDLCPVDTHVHRIAKRLGWVNDKMSAEKTFWRLKPYVPAGKGHSLHMNLLQFGRTVCHARKPKCGKCFLWGECTWEGKSI